MSALKKCRTFFFLVRHLTVLQRQSLEENKKNKLLLFSFERHEMNWPGLFVTSFFLFFFLDHWCKRLVPLRQIDYVIVTVRNRGAGFHLTASPFISFQSESAQTALTGKHKQTRVKVRSRLHLVCWVQISAKLMLLVYFPLGLVWFHAADN